MEDEYSEQAPKDTQSKDNARAGKLWLVCGGLILLGIILISLNSVLPKVQPGTWPDVALDIMRNLGIAILIAGVLSGPVDIYFRNRQRRDEEFFRERRQREEKLLRDQINENVFLAVLKQNFSEPIFEQVYAHILTNPFLRRNFQIVTSMEWCEGKKCLKSLVTQEYEVERLATRECTYALSGNLDIEPEFGARFTSLEISTQDGQVIEKYDDKEVNDKLVRYDKESQLVYLEKNINMRNHQILKVRFSAEVYYKAQDYMVWMMTLITHGLTLRYNAPSDLEFLFSPNHPSGHEFTEFDDGMSREYQFKGGFLPYQGATVRWYPKVEQKEEQPKTVEQGSGQ